MMFEGVVEEILYNNEVNGYTVLELKTQKDSIAVVGYLPFVHIGETIKVSGIWVQHPDYGEQLKVEAYEKIEPQNVEMLCRYLASGILKGIGPATADKIVDKFGMDTMQIMLKEPHRLSEVKGIRLDKALKIGQAFMEEKELGCIIQFFQGYGIHPICAVKVYKEYGNETLERIKQNPYILCIKEFGVLFKTADKIALDRGLEPCSKDRLSSGLRYVLEMAAGDGHTYLPEGKLSEDAAGLLGISVREVKNSIIELLVERVIVQDKVFSDVRIYLNELYDAEITICKKINEFSETMFDVDRKEFDKEICDFELKEEIVLAKAQKDAIFEAMENGVLIITGGPGTGKTTIIKSIIKLLSSSGYKIALAAPTGRAAKRMSEATNYEAKTIHRLLEIGYGSEKGVQFFNRNETNPIDAHVIIIDEMSMVDIPLMGSLLSAVGVGTKLILVGDANQLPSVGPGNVLKDMINSGFIKTVRLMEIFRQAQESMIIVNAHRIHHGEFPRLNVKNKDFYFLREQRAEEIVNKVVELAVKRLPAKYNYDPMRHIQILTPARKGLTGVLNLNIELQKILNPKDINKAEKSYRDFVFRMGDKVMQVKNNYNMKWVQGDNTEIEGEGVFNGDMGLITTLDHEKHVLTVLFDDGRSVDYDYSILDEIEPAYAITVHKSQGSEFPVVILPVFQGSPLLYTRNLLYTAVSRARELVVLVGHEKTITNMIQNNRETSRFSGLYDKLKICFEGF